MRISRILRAAILIIPFAAMISAAGCADQHPERNPLWNVPRNGANQPVDQNGIPLPGYALGPH